MKLAGLLALAALSTPTTSFAFEGPGDTQALPCRPTIACTAELVVPGAFELEAGTIYRSLAGNEKQLTTPFLAKLTVTKWLQLQLGSNGYTSAHGPAPAEYFDNLMPGVKFQLKGQTKWTPSVSFSFNASLPTTAQPGYARYDGALLTGYVTKDIGPVHADLNLGLNRFGINEPAPTTQGWVALALSVALPKGFGVMLENYYFSPALPEAARDAGLLGAISYSPRPWLVFDAGPDVGYVPSVRSFSLFAGLTVVPFRLWKAD